MAACAGYSERGAHVRGAELLANRNISAVVEQAMAERSERTELLGKTRCAEAIKAAIGERAGRAPACC